MNKNNNSIIYNAINTARRSLSEFISCGCCTTDDVKFQRASETRQNN